jgi:uncharacterized protein YbjT (DUF2867 family)
MASQHRSRTICVLGGSGFVGRTLCARLVRAGYSVRVPTRSRQRNRDLLVLPGLELLTADIHDTETLRSLVGGSDAVVNLVGILNERGHDGSGFHRAHVELVEKLVDVCQELGVRRLIQMSALKANADRGPSHYLRTKGQAEKVIKELGGGDIDFTIFRPSVIFGPDDAFLNRFARLLKLAPVLPLPGMGARFAPVYVEDVATAVVRALADAGTFGKTYELCGPDIYSLGEIIAFIRHELALRRFVIGMPAPLGRIQAWFADYLIPGKPFSIDNLKSMTVASVCSTDGLGQLGIKATAMPMIAHGYLRREPDALAQLRRHKSY